MRVVCCGGALCRSRLAIIPQDPFLFSGTIRENLDPCGRNPDQQLLDVLDQCHLSSAVNRMGEMPRRTRLKRCDEEVVNEVRREDGMTQGIYDEHRDACAAGCGWLEFTHLTRCFDLKHQVIWMDKSTTCC